jgi:hypothetical protein
MCRYCASLKSHLNDSTALPYNVEVIWTLPSFRIEQHTQLFHFFKENDYKTLIREHPNECIRQTIRFSSIFIRVFDMMRDPEKFSFDTFIALSVIPCMLSHDLQLYIVDQISRYPLRNELDNPNGHDVIRKCSKNSKRFSNFQNIRQELNWYPCLLRATNSVILIATVLKRHGTCHNMELDDLSTLFWYLIERLVINHKDIVVTFSFEDYFIPTLLFLPLVPACCRACGTIKNLRPCSKCQWTLFCSDTCNSHILHKDCNDTKIYAPIHRFVNDLFVTKNSPFYLNDAHRLMQID